MEQIVYHCRLFELKTAAQGAELHFGSTSGTKAANLRSSSLPEE
jgi:hypothetical protein